MGKNQDLDPGSRSGMNIQDNISESLETIYWVKILKILWCGSESRIRNIFEPGFGMEKIRILDPGCLSRIRNNGTYVYLPIWRDPCRRQQRHRAQWGPWGWTRKPPRSSSSLQQRIIYLRWKAGIPFTLRNILSNLYRVPVRGSAHPSEGYHSKQCFGSGSIVGGTDPSGSFYHAKIIRKILIPTVLWLLCDFYNWKMM
jgi:hypothetical protein